MEHHSNLVPWQMLAQERGASLVYVADRRRRAARPRLARRGARARAEAARRRARLERARRRSTRSRRSPPRARRRRDRGGRRRAGRAAHAGRRRARSAPTSTPGPAHKAYGPTGIGVLHGRGELLEAMPPWLGGGHMIKRVGDQESTYAEPPARFEAGTSAIAEAIGLGAAVDFLSEIGMDAVRAHGREIVGYALERLREVEGLTLYGPADLDAARQRDRVQPRRRAPARRRRDPRPRGRLHPRRPPLRAAADAPPRRRRDVARELRGALHARRRRPPDRRARLRSGRCSADGRPLSREHPGSLQAAA